MAVIGAGPTGLVATALFGRHHRLALIERQPARCSLPRAGHVDHEVMRILQRLDLRSAQRLRFQHDLMMYQPVLEDGVWAAIERAPAEPAIEMGWEMVGLEEEADRAAVTVRRRRQGEVAAAREPAEERS